MSDPNVSPEPTQQVADEFVPETDELDGAGEGVPDFGDDPDYVEDGEH